MITEADDEQQMGKEFPVKTEIREYNEGGPQCPNPSALQKTRSFLSECESPLACTAEKV